MSNCGIHQWFSHVLSRDNNRPLRLSSSSSNALFLYILKNFRFKPTGELQKYALTDRNLMTSLSLSITFWNNAVDLLMRFSRILSDWVTHGSKNRCVVNGSCNTLRTALFHAVHTSLMSLTCSTADCHKMNNNMFEITLTQHRCL